MDFSSAFGWLFVALAVINFLWFIAAAKAVVKIETQKSLKESKVGEAVPGILGDDSHLRKSQELAMGQALIAFVFTLTFTWLAGGIL